MRVTHVVHDLNGGGFESLIAAMARRLADSSVVLSTISLSGREGRVGGVIRRLLDQYLVMGPMHPVSMLAPVALARTIAATRPDVVHLHSGVWHKGSLAARRAGVRGVVYTEHGREHFNFSRIARSLDRLASKRTDVVVAVSDRLHRYLVDSLGVSGRRVVTIPNGVDTHEFCPGPAPRAFRASLGLAPDSLVIGSVGRLEPVKAYSRLVEAVARVRALGTPRPLQCVIWGDGPERPGLEALVRSLGLERDILLPGWTDSPVAAHRTLDVFVLTSISEGTSVSLLEALACGVAPVVTDVGGNGDVLGTALAGQLVPSGDADRLAAALRDMLGDRERRERAGRLGRARVVARYSLDGMIERYLGAYRLALGAEPEAGRSRLAG